MDPWFLAQHVGHHVEAAASGVHWRAARDGPHGTPTVRWLLAGFPAAKLPLTDDVQQMAVHSRRLDQPGWLGQADPDPHTGVGHQGAIVPHPGTRVPPILLKRHVADALAKVGEDMRHLRGEREWECEDLWALPFLHLLNRHSPRPARYQALL